jgi:uracil-DNA glycosylase
MGRDRLAETDWSECLRGVFETQYWREMEQFVDAERARGPVFPTADEVFRALELTSCAETRVVIVGQDPYQRPGLAHGLCFSVPCGVRPLPPSLKSIHRVLEADGYWHIDDGNLEAWANQGVLLLNTALTVAANKRLSHAKQWGPFTDEVIRVVTLKRNPVFLLWGRKAQRKQAIITGAAMSPPRIMRSSHPAPPACYGPCGDTPPFVKSHPFLDANAFLGDDGIEWGLGDC